jgi:lipoprotein NlpD
MTIGTGIKRTGGKGGKPSTPGCMRTGMMILSIMFCLVLLSSCHRHRHRSVPVESQSTAMVKRQLNSDGSYYVRSGDTLYAIAFSYGVDPMNVAKWNGVASPYTIYPGQKLRLSAPSAGNRGSKSSTGVQISAIKKPSQTTTKTVNQSTKSSQPKPVPKSSKPSPTGSSSTKSANSGKTSKSNPADPKSWKWPTSGRVLRGYVAGDPARNGLDISGREGQAVIASAKGKVVYSGSGLIGYGELIIIKHSEKMLSAYAHNKVRLVKEGEQVTAGQKIAEMGRNSGDEQLLHFEIRARGKPVNPLNYLPAK